jgi:hypothetical protein
MQEKLPLSKWITATKSRGSRTKEAAVDFRSRSPSDDYAPPLQNPKNGRPFRLHRAYATRARLQGQDERATPARP